MGVILYIVDCEIQGSLKNTQLLSPKGLNTEPHEMRPKAEVYLR